MTFEYYMIYSASGEVVARRRRPANLHPGQVAVPMRVELPNEWFNPETARVTLRLAGPVRDGFMLAADQPFAGDNTPFRVDTGGEIHLPGDHDCNRGWCGGDNGYPKPCPCGGLVHADFDGYSDGDGAHQLSTRCDACGRGEFDVE